VEVDRGSSNDFLSNLSQELFMIRETGVREEGERLIELQIGPAHPGSGHMRILAWVDGDIVVRCDPDIGFVHRTIEKLSENRAYIKTIPLVERPSLLDTTPMTIGYVNAVEKLMGIEAPPRAEYLRTILAEITRIASHFYGIGILAIFLGHSTGFMWAFGDREVMIELATMLTGARITYAYVIPGGVRRDMPQNFPDQVEKGLRYIERRLKDWEKLFLNNPVVERRLRDIGVLKPVMARRLGITGPNLRASGVDYDVRMAEPYEAYDEIDFMIPVAEEGDAYARGLVRFKEIEQSISIIRQAIKKIPDGDIISPQISRLFNPLMKKIYAETRRVKFPSLLATLKPPKGEAMARVEAGRGEALFHIISDGSTNPYRFRFVTPSFRNVILFKYLIPGHRVADIPAIYGSIDYFPPEADR
jgi:NADH-quinone oxidoreductase subunit D